MKVTISGTLNLELEEEEPRMVFSINSNGIITKDVSMLVLPNDHKCTASITPVDAHGNPAQIDGLATWGSSNDQIATLTGISPDSLSADIVPGTQLGTCQINVQADADLGSGITNISGVLDLSVVAGQAVGFTIQTGAPVPITK